MSCQSCEHFNLHYYQEDPPHIRGSWGECVYPHRMNLDHIKDIIPKEERTRVSILHNCDKYMAQRCYGGQ